MVENEKNSPQSDSCLANEKDGGMNNTYDRNRQETVNNTQKSGQNTNITAGNEQKQQIIHGSGSVTSHIPTIVRLKSTKENSDVQSRNQDKQ